MTNIYLEKIAQFEKRAWETNYDDEDSYGFGANRDIGNHMVVDQLRKVSKDPHLEVLVDGETDDGKWKSFSSKKDPVGFNSHLDYIHNASGAKTSK